MSNDKEKLAAIDKLIDSDENLTVVQLIDKLRILLEEAEVTHIYIEPTGYGTVRVNDVNCAVLPVSKLRELNANIATLVQQASQEALVKRGRVGHE